MTIFASDDFNGSVGTNISTWNPAWVKTPGVSSATLQIQTTQAVGRYEDSNYYHSAVPPSADYSVRATFRVRVASAWGRCGLVARSSASEYTQYRADLRSGNSGTTLAGSLWLIRTVAGSEVTLATTSFRISASDYPAELKVVGDRIELWIGGTLRLGANDPTPIIGAGHAGIYVRNFYTQKDFLIDNFEAESLASAPVRKRCPLLLAPW